MPRSQILNILDKYDTITRASALGWPLQLDKHWHVVGSSVYFGGSRDLTPPRSLRLRRCVRAQRSDPWRQVHVIDAHLHFEVTTQASHHVVSQWWSTMFSRALLCFIPLVVATAHGRRGLVSRWCRRQYMRSDDFAETNHARPKARRDGQPTRRMQRVKPCDFI